MQSFAFLKGTLNGSTKTGGFLNFYCLLNVILRATQEADQEADERQEVLEELRDLAERKNDDRVRRYLENNEYAPLWELRELLSDLK